MEMNMGFKKRISDFLYKIQKSRAGFYAAICLAVVTVLASILYFVFWPDNLMHSDMAAEVMLSKLLSEEGSLISKNWFYSTEPDFQKLVLFDGDQDCIHAACHDTVVPFYQRFWCRKADFRYFL